MTNRVQIKDSSIIFSNKEWATHLDDFAKFADRFFFQFPKDFRYRYTSSNLQSLHINVVSQSQTEN